MYDKVFSDFEVDRLGFKIGEAEAYREIECVGSIEEEMEARVITKKCRGIVRKTRTKGTGRGKLKISAHLPWEVFVNAHGMVLPSLKEGIYAYGENSVHPTISVTAHVTDEDGVEKLKAYPNGMITTGITRKIENGGTEVAEMNLEIDISPDEFGNGVYETILSGDSSIGISVEDWMTTFEPDMAQAVV